MDVKAAVKQRLAQALWQLGRELESQGEQLPDGSYQVAIKEGVTRVFEEAELVRQAEPNKASRLSPYSLSPAKSLAETDPSADE